MPRDLDAVLDGMGWQLDDTERADMHKLQVAALLAWGVHPDSIGPTRKGRGYIAQAMADALQRVETADVSAPPQATAEPPATRAEAESNDWRTRLTVNLLRQGAALTEKQIRALIDHAVDGIEPDPALFAKAPPEPVGEPAAWRWFNSNGDQVSNWLDFKAAQKAKVEAQVAEAGGRIEYAYARPAPGVPNPIGHIALTPAEIQSGMDRVRWAENLIRQLPEDHDGRNSWLLNYSKACLTPAAYDTLEQLEFFQRVEALADRATQRPPFADRWTFDGQALRAFAQALHSSESRQVGTVMLHISKADGDKLAEALRLAKPGPVVLESAPPIAPQFDEAVKVLQAWGYSFAGGKWAPPQGAPFYVKRANVSRVRRGSPPATDVVLVASLDTVSIPGDWVAVYPGPAEAVRQATAEEVFLAEVLDEVLRARAKFPGDRVMGLALAEKFGELIKAVLDESPDRVRREAVQTAAMCVRLVLDGDGSVKEWMARGLAPLFQPKEGPAT